MCPEPSHRVIPRAGAHPLLHIRFPKTIPFFFSFLFFKTSKKGFSEFKQQKHTAIAFGKTDVSFKWPQKLNIDTFNLALRADVLKQSFAESSVQYVFLSLLLQRMRGVGSTKVTRMK